MSEEEVVEVNDEALEAAVAGAADDSELPDQDRADEPKGVEKALLDTKAELTRKSQELSDIKERLAKVEGFREGREAKEEPPPENPFAILDDEKFAETLFEDPKHVIKALKTIVGTFGKGINDRDAFYQAELAKLRDELDPATQTLNQKIAELRKDPDFADMPRAILAKFAKKGIAKPGTAEYPGSPGSSRPAAGRSPNTDKKEVNRFLEKLGYGED